MSMLGVAIGVAVLIVVLSVMNGFERELRERILSVTSHATVTAFGAGLQRLAGAARAGARKPCSRRRWPLRRGRGAADRRARATAPRRRSPCAAWTRRSRRRCPAIGATHAQRVARRRSSPAQFRMLLGAEVAARLGVAAGDTVVLAIAQGTVTPAGVVPRMRRFTVGGDLLLGHVRDRQRARARATSSDAARLFRTGDDVSGLRLAVRDPLLAPSVVARGGARHSAAASGSRTGRSATPTSSAPSSSPSA